MPLQPGSNALAITTTSPGGAVEFTQQSFDVVRRGEHGWLVIPRERQRLGAVRGLSADAPLPAGETFLRLEVPPGTQVTSPDASLHAGPDGESACRCGSRRAATPSPHAGSPAQTPSTVTVSVEARAQAFAVGLLDVEASIAPAGGGFRLRGRGALHGEAQLGPVQVVGELDLRDTDLRQLHDAPLADWLRPRLPERFER
ncbi:flagellar motor protein, partial [Corallococcus sp. 4LFB]